MSIQLFRKCAVTLLTGMVLFWGPSADAARRIALVIGNQTYQDLPRLEKAVADAQGYASVLEAKGFDNVLYRENLTGRDMNFAIAQFLDGVQPGDTAVFVYAGHGWSDGSTNFMVGTDAPSVASQSMLARISIPLQNGVNGVIDEMNGRGAALKVAIIDACRDNPFESTVPGRSIGLSRGLSRVEPPSGTFVVFSAGANQTALDRLSNTDPYPQSVFTRTFLPLINADLPLLDAIKAAQTEVYDLARMVPHDQEPAYYDQVRGNVCLSSNCRGMGAAQPTPAPDPPQDFATPYTAANEIDTIEGWTAFLNQCSDSIYCGLAEAALRKLEQQQQASEAERAHQLEEEAFWRGVANSPSPGDLLSYLQAYPAGRFVEQARQRLSTLQANETEAVQAGATRQQTTSLQPDEPEAAPAGATRQQMASLQETEDETRRALEQEEEHWGRVAESQDTDDLWSYLEEYPDGRFRGEARQRLASLQAAEAEMRRALEREEDHWGRAAESEDLDDVQSYLDTYPDGRFEGEARQRLASLQAAEAEMQRALEQEEDHWGRVAESRSQDDLRSYLDTYPDGRFEGEARRRIASLQAAEAETRRALEQEEDFWEQVADSEDRDDLWSYLETYPDGRFRGEARQRLASLQAAEAETRWALEREQGFWDRVAESPDQDDLQSYLDSYPDGRFTAEARQRLAALQDAASEAKRAEEERLELSAREVRIELQKVLKDAGCYSSGIDGIWGKNSRRALQEFMRHTGINGSADPTPRLVEKAKATSYSKPVCREVAKAPPARKVKAKKQKVSPPTPRITRTAPPPPPTPSRPNVIVLP